MKYNLQPWSIDNTACKTSPPSMPRALKSAWDAAIQVELQQLQEKQTWKLVDSLDQAIPLTNKWVFVKKRDKEGKITKYKAQLIAKGCMQRPGHNYIETHLPVIRLETI